MSHFSTIFADDLKQSFRDKRIIAVVVIYLIILLWGLKKAVILSGIWNLWLVDILGFGRELPFPIIFFYFASIALLPLFSLLLSYDVLSGEAKTIRNLVYRCRRAEIFFAKFLAIFLINILANLVMYAVAIDFISSQQAASYAWPGIILFIFLAFFALYFTSLSVMASSLFTSAKKSLFFGALFVIMPLLLLLNKTTSIISPFHYYKYGIKLFTASFSIWPFVLLIASSAIFLGIAYFTFERRDL